MKAAFDSYIASLGLDLVTTPEQLGRQAERAEQDILDFVMVETPSELEAMQLEMGNAMRDFQKALIAVDEAASMSSNEQMQAAGAKLDAACA